ncbi:hypothetical protein HMPREF2559_06345 [Corynebacterium sp. HMSC072G08]|nr:dethiobiotin synthase domain protein [Corynebacterium sp. DNF00584]OFN39663.1 hypothetical protein HMPREF2559_06345 [Corynebacterium sp. HMSC072G08]
MVERFLAGMSEGKDVGAALAESGASVLQVPTLVATVAELSQYYLILESHTHPGLSIEQLVGIGLIAALPNLAYEGAMSDYLIPVLEVASEPLNSISPEVGA